MGIAWQCPRQHSQSYPTNQEAVKNACPHRQQAIRPCVVQCTSSEIFKDLVFRRFLGFPLTLFEQGNLRHWPVRCLFGMHISINGQRGLVNSLAPLNPKESDGGDSPRLNGYLQGSMEDCILMGWGKRAGLNAWSGMRQFELWCACSRDGAKICGMGDRVAPPPCHSASLCGILHLLGATLRSSFAR